MQIILFTDVADTPGYGKYAGTYKLATELRIAGYQCQVVDNFSWYSLDQLKTIVDKFVTSDTCLVGFSCTLNEKRVDGTVLHWGIDNNIFEEFINYIKIKNNNIKIAVGGARITVTSDWHFVDYAVVNKADIALIEIVKHLLTGSELKYTQGPNSKVVNGNDYFYTQDQFNDSHIIFDKNDIIFDNEALPIEIARGCIFSCAYCHFDLIGKRVGDWTKNPKTIRDEMIRNYEMFGTTNYMITDELINESISKMQMLTDLFQSLPFRIRYTAYARVDLIWRYPEMRELLLDSGALSLTFGIETFNEKAGKAVGKGLSPDKVKETLHYCRETWKGKIITSSNFMVGLPHEDEESIWRTVEYLLSDDNPLDLYSFLPLFMRAEDDGRPTSKFDSNPKKFGYTVKSDNSWESNVMNSVASRDLVRRIYQDERIKKKSKFLTAIWLGRILSLGYTVDDIFTMLNSDITYENEITQKTNICKELYFNNLLNLSAN